MAKPQVKNLPSLMQAFLEMQDCKNHSRIVVLVAHGFIELMVNVLIDAHCTNHKRISSSRRDYPHATKLLILHELKIISDDRYKELDSYRDLRNRAAHETVFRIKSDDFSFIKIRRAIAEHTAKESVAERFFWASLELLGNFWNDTA